MQLYVEVNSFSQDEYDCPLSLVVKTPEGDVTLATIRYGCEEAKDVAPNLAAFADDLVTAYNKEHA